MEQRTSIQETPCCIEECNPVLRAAPPATVDDAWEETYIDHGDYQSVEESLLQIRITSKNYKKQIMTAIALGCPIDSSTLRMCETMVRPVELVEETPVPSLAMALVPSPAARMVPPPVVRTVPPPAILVPRILSQGDRRQPQGDRRQISVVPSRPNGGGHRMPLAAIQVHRTPSATPSGWLGTEE